MTKAGALFLSLAFLALITIGGRAAGNLYRKGTLSLARDPLAMMGLSLPEALSTLRFDPTLKGAVTQTVARTRVGMLGGWAFDPAAPTVPLRVVLFDTRAFSAGHAEASWADPQAALNAGAPPNSAFYVPLAHCTPGVPLTLIAVTPDARYAPLPFSGAPSQCS